MLEWSAIADHTRGSIASADRVAGTIAKISKNSASQGALAVEMEAAGAVSDAIAAGLPFCCVKVVSDRADEEFVMDFNRMRTTDGRFSRGKIVIYALTHPLSMPRLVSAEDADRKIAASALGAFLASCRFQFSDTHAEPRRKSVMIPATC